MNANYWWRMKLDFAANILWRCGNDFWKKEWYKRRGFFLKKKKLHPFISFFVIVTFYLQVIHEIWVKIINKLQFFYWCYFFILRFFFYYIEELDIWTQYLNVPKKRKILSPFFLKIFNTFLGPQGHGEWCLCLCI